MTEEKARELTKCLGCDKEKDIGLVVCWNCFKHRSNAFKNSNKPLNEWLQSINHD